jgi:mono/diheme cytochrome c family protein
MRILNLDHNFLAWLAPVAVAGLLSACGGGDRGAAGGGETGAAGEETTPPPAATTPPAGEAAPPPADTAPAGGADTAAPAGEAEGAAAGGGGGGASQQLIALGDSIFHGQAGGGTCYACHGQDGKGSGVGPNLTDNEWLNTDGTLEGITKTIQSGVPQPKQAPAPMPPMGGASLSPEQVKAAAAYVHSLGGGK